MAELIQRDDSLNTGREKLNEAIKASDRSEDKADYAVETADTAKGTADVTREEMQAIIREQTQNGDLAPEVAQARQGAATLGDNLNSIKTDLAQSESDVAILKSTKADEVTTLNRLDMKRNKDEKITNADLDTSSDGKKIKLVNLSDEVQQALTGNAPALPTLSEGQVVEEYLAEGAVTETKASFIERSRNLFDVKTITIGKTINTTTGAITDNAATIMSDFIPVKQQTMYSRRNLCSVIRYRDGDFISGVVNGTTPVNTGVATHVRLVMPLTQVYRQQFQEGETIIDEEHGIKLANEVDKNKEISEVVNSGYMNKKSNELYSSFNFIENISSLNSVNAYLHDDYKYVWRTENKSIKVKTTGVSPSYLQGNFNGKIVEGMSEILAAIYIPNPELISGFEFQMVMTDGTVWKAGRVDYEKGWNIFRLVATQSTYGEWADFDYFRIYAYTNAPTEFYVGKMCGVIQNKAKIMIVNDHGYSNFKNVAYPQLKALGIPVTWAVNPGRLGGTGGILTESEIDELANDPYSDINFHAWNPTEQATQFMTADELRTDTLKCMRWIQSKGYQPQSWWRSVFVQNEANNHAAIQDMVEAYSTPQSSAGYELYPFIDKWNVGRISLHGRDEAWFDDTFEILKKTRPLLVLYTHDIHETDPIDLPEAQFNYFISKLSTAVNEGWIEGVTYDQLKNRYSRVFDVNDIADYLDTL